MKKRVLACLAALTLAMSLLPVTALAEEGTTSGGTDSQVVSGVSKSKTATELNTGSWTSDITLSLPSAEEKLESDIVFVLDGSSSTADNVVVETLALLADLKAEVEKSGAAVNVCVVKFKRLADKSAWFDLSTQYSEIEGTVKSYLSGGSNIHAGLLAGQAALAEHENIPAARKHLILVSDGSTYLYCKEGMWDINKEDIEGGYLPFTRSYLPKTDGRAGSFNDTANFEPNFHTGEGENIPHPKTTSEVAAWQEYLKDVEARNKESNGDSYDYHCEYNNNFNLGIPSKDHVQQPEAIRSASNRDMAYYYADQTWQEMKDAGYQLYSIATQDMSAGAGNADDSYCFMNYLNGGKSLNFADIENEIIYLVDAGSYVNDYMGYVEGDYNFDLVNQASKLYITEGKTRLDAVEIEANKYGFGMWKEGETVGYKYVVTYTPAADGQEHIEWTINVPVTNLRHVQLHYTVELTNPKTAVGTYGKYDEDGSKGYDGLYTNNSATLYPMATGATETGEGEDFLKPTVSYEVKGGGGTIITPVKPDPKPQPQPPTDIDNPTTPTDPGDPGSDIDDPNTPTSPAEPPKTGDMMPLFAGMAAVSAAAIMLLSRKRKEA